MKFSSVVVVVDGDVVVVVAGIGSEVKCAALEKRKEKS